MRKIFIRNNIVYTIALLLLQIITLNAIIINEIKL